MLGIDLSALSSAELARLMQVSQAKGQSEMTAELHREMARRSGVPQAATAMTWSHPAFERPVADSPETTGDPSPRRTAALAALLAGALVASSGAGWWLTRAPAAPPPAAAAAPPSPADLPAPASTPAPAPTVAPAPPPTASSSRTRPVRMAARPHRHAAASHHRTRHHRAPPPKPRRRHGLFHRLTGWLRPDSSSRD